MDRRLCMFLLVASLAVVATAKPIYVQELPNVPVVDGAPWPGVGHNARAGGGSRYAFGRDFAAAGHKWTPELCRKDSDADGFTNGQELGDPSCSWQKGQPNPLAAAGVTFSHPGLANSVPQLGGAPAGR